MPKRSTLRLTTRSVAALPATGRDAVHWDRALAGFGVRVQRNGRKVYIVQSRGPAGLKRVTLGPVAGEAIDQRRREASEVIDRIKRGLDPVPQEPEPDPTVADLAERCMRAYVKVHCKPKTESLYRTAIDLHIVPALGAMAVKDVRSSHVIEFHDRLRDTPSMANPCHTHAVEDVHARTNMGPRAQGPQSLPGGQPIPRALPGAVPVARGVPERRRGAQGRGSRRLDVAGRRSRRSDC